MANEPKVKYAIGESSRVQAGIAAGKIDEFDLLLLDGDTDPKIGWVDKNGVPRIVDTSGQKEILSVDFLPSTGESEKIYLYDGEAYIWDTSTTAFVPISKSTDLTELEQEVAKKVDEATVDAKISQALQGVGVEVIEF